MKRIYKVVGPACLLALFECGVLLSSCNVSAQDIASNKASENPVNENAERTADYDSGSVGQLAWSASRQSEQEQLATLQSVKKIDDHPLYTIVYEGDYETDSIKLWKGQDASLPADFGCSLFYQHSVGRSQLGRNFDWESQPALLVFTKPPGRYASISMVDTSLLGMDRARLAKFDTVNDRRALLEAVQVPLDGMNDQGLAIGIAVVPRAEFVDDPLKPNAHALHLVRMILDHAANVQEAKSILEKYDIMFMGGPQVHFLIGDASGHSMVAEVRNGKTEYLHNDATADKALNWQAATNFPLCDQEQPASRCGRYARIAKALSGKDADEVEPMVLLSDVAQPNTQWSAVYDLTNLKVQLVMGRKYEQAYSLKLGSDLKLPEEQPQQ